MTFFSVLFSGTAGRNKIFNYATGWFRYISTFLHKQQYILLLPHIRNILGYGLVS